MIGRLMASIDRRKQSPSIFLNSPALLQSSLLPVTFFAMLESVVSRRIPYGLQGVNQELRELISLNVTALLQNFLEKSHLMCV